MTVAVLATLVALAIVIENWRGDRAWRSLIAEYAARGDPLDVLPLPAALPVERNFMKAPVLERLLCSRIDNVDELKAFLRAAPVAAGGSFEWRSGRVFDATKFIERQRGVKSVGFSAHGQSFTVEKTQPLPKANSGSEAGYACGDLFVFLQPVAPWLDELAKATATRAESQFVRSESIRREAPYAAPIPSFQVIRALLTALSARAGAALVADRPSEANDDVVAALRMGRGFSDMPDAMLVEAMIGAVCANLALQPVWEGCCRHQWNEAQLARLQSEMAAMHPIAGLERSLRTFRPVFALDLDCLPVTELLGLNQARKPKRWDWRSLVWMPRGWVQQNKVSGISLMQFGIDAVAAHSTPRFLSKVAERDRATERFGTRGMSPYTLLAFADVLAYDKVTLNAAAAETNVRLAQTACALERHRLARGGYPETLGELVPAFLTAVPRDVIDGQLLRYRRLTDGTFKLYSIGLNGKDDDGAPANWDGRDAGLTGDWTWPQLAK